MNYLVAPLSLSYKMKLITLKHRYDYGHEWYIQVLNIKGWTLLQASVSWNDYSSWPYLQIKSGSGSTISVLFWTYKFGIDIGFIERTWNWDFVENYTDERVEEFLKMDEC